MTAYDEPKRSSRRRKCFTCGAPATHRSKRITPAGYHAYELCERHAHPSPWDTWGSDPGWPTLYERVGEETEA